MRVNVQANTVPTHTVHIQTIGLDICMPRLLCSNSRLENFGNANLIVQPYTLLSPRAEIVLSRESQIQEAGNEGRQQTRIPIRNLPVRISFRATYRKFLPRLLGAGS